MSLDQLISFITQKIPVGIFRGVNAASAKATFMEILNFFQLKKIDTISFPNMGLTSEHIGLAAMQVIDGGVAKATLAQPEDIGGGVLVVTRSILGIVHGFEGSNVLLIPPAQLTALKLSTEADGGIAVVLPDTGVSQYLVAWKNGTFIPYSAYITESGFDPDVFNDNEANFARLRLLYYGYENKSAGATIVAGVVDDPSAALPSIPITETESFTQLASEDVLVEGEEETPIEFLGYIEKTFTDVVDAVAVGLFRLGDFLTPIIGGLKTVAQLDPEATEVEIADYTSSLSAVLVEPAEGGGLPFSFAMAATAEYAVKICSIDAAQLNAGVTTNLTIGAGITDLFYAVGFACKIQDAVTSTSSYDSTLVLDLVINGNAFASLFIPDVTTQGYMAVMRDMAVTVQQDNVNEGDDIEVSMSFDGVNPEDFTGGLIDAWILFKKFPS